MKSLDFLVSRKRLVNPGINFEVTMLNPSGINDEEKKLLEEVAKAKNMTLEEVLVELGHIAAEPDKEVKVEGEKEEKPEDLEIKLGAPVTPAEDIEEQIAEPEVVPEAAPPPPEEEEEKDDEEEPDMPATVNHVCKMCGWDQSIPAIPEPPHQDKIAFLQAVIGQKVFSKRYTLFGGELKVTFRTLTIKEIDALYQETFKAQKAGVIVTTADYYEYLNRLRLYLQITSMSATSSALHIKLPDGLTEETHPGVKSYWKSFLKEQKKFDDSKSLIEQIADYVIFEVLKTEHLQRAITHECNKFNKLVAKLEACVDNPDFWKETEQPS